MPSALLGASLGTLLGVSWSALGRPWAPLVPPMPPTAPWGPMLERFLVDYGPVLHRCFAPVCSRQLSLGASNFQGAAAAAAPSAVAVALVDAAATVAFDLEPCSSFVVILCKRTRVGREVFDCSERFETSKGHVQHQKSCTAGLPQEVPSADSATNEVTKQLPISTAPSFDSTCCRGVSTGAH